MTLELNHSYVQECDIKHLKLVYKPKFLAFYIRNVNLHAYSFKTFIIVVHFEAINLAVVITYELLVTVFQQCFSET